MHCPEAPIGIIAFFMLLPLYVPLRLILWLPLHLNNLFIRFNNTAMEMLFN